MSKEDERLAKRKAFQTKWAEAAEQAYCKDNGIEYAPPKMRMNYTELVDETFVRCMETIQHFHPECVRMELVLDKVPTEDDPDNYDHITRAIRLFGRDEDGEFYKIDTPEFIG